jgi:hypothetical protein
VCRQIDRELPYDGRNVERQASHAGVTGRIDVLLRLTAGIRECARILVENKLNSGFSKAHRCEIPDQPARYAASATAMSRLGRPAFAVIVAPRAYIERSRHIAPFHARIAYEDLAPLVDAADREVIDAAIRRFVMPEPGIMSPAATEFHQGYKEVAAQVAPELVVKDNPNVGDGRPEGSRTIYFDVEQTLRTWDFLPTATFSHQCWDKDSPSPSVKVMFRGWRRHVDTVRRAAKDDLANTRLYIRPAKGSLALVLDTPRMENTIPVRRQMDSVVTGIVAAQRMRAWLLANEDALRRWASAVGAAP